MSISNAHRLPAIIIMLLIVGSLSVLASPELENNPYVLDDYLVIIYPQFDTYPLDNITFYFHVGLHNNGSLTNETTNCFVHLNNVTGDHILNEQLAYDAITQDFWFDYDFDTTGDYHYTVACVYYKYVNQELAGVNYGAVSTGFEVTEKGRRSPDNFSPIAALILIPLLFGIMLLFGAFSLSEKHAVIKLFLFFLSIVSLWSSLNMGMQTIIKYYNFPELQGVIGDLTLWSGYAFAVILIYFCIYLLWLLFHSIAKNKQEELKY